MTFLPIVERELRVAARRRSTWWLRLGGALATLFVASLFFLTIGLSGSHASVGGPMFGTLSWLCFLMTLLAGLFFTSDCLSEEKREGTLGLLFLTDLGGFDVVLGKLVATSLRASYALLAAFPILALALLAGGLTGAHFWKAILSLLNTLFFSLAVGLLVSSVSRDSQRAMAGTLGLILLATIGLPLLDLLWGLFTRNSHQKLFMFANPAYAFGRSDERGATFWYATVVVHALGWVCLWLAGNRAARTWQERQRATRTSFARSSGRFQRHGSILRHDTRRQKMLAINPAYWLAARNRWQGLALYVCTLFLLIGVGILLSLFEADAGGMVASYFICQLLVLGIYLYVASQASRFFIDNWRSGALELLLASPLSGREIIAGQWVALRGIFLLPVATLMLVRLGLGLLQYGSLGVNAGFAGASAMGWGSLWLQFVLEVAMTSTGLLATAWVGMWLGLKLRRANLAVGFTLLLVMVIPVIGYSFLGGFLTFLVVTGGVPAWANIFFMSGLWIVKDLVFIGWARRRLQDDFRETAARTVLPEVKGGILPAGYKSVASTTDPSGCAAPMNTLPIVARELRVAARRRNTHRIRVLVAFLAIAVAAWMAFTWSASVPPSVAGRNIFGTLSTLAFVFCLMSGIRTTANCLSSEKRDGTLGLLSLTDLKGYDIVAGKLAASSLGVTYALGAIFPVLALPLLLGGTTALQAGHMMLTLANTLFFSLAAGMLASALTHREWKTMLLTLGLILFMAGGLPLFGALWTELVLKNAVPEPHWIFLMPSPCYAFVLALSPDTLLKGTEVFWTSTIAVHCQGWIFLVLATLVLPRWWRDRTLDAAPNGLRLAWRRLNFGGVRTRLAIRRRLLDVNPMLWLAGRGRMASWFIRGFLVLGGIGWLLGYARYGREWLEAVIAILTALFAHSLLKLWIACAACERLSEDRREGTLELLLSTPLSVRDILRGHRLALQRMFLGPICIVLMADILLLFGALNAMGNEFIAGTDMKELTLTFFAGMVMLVADAVALTYVGMWQGLTARNLIQACSNTVFQLLVLPWVAFVGLMMLLEASQLWRVYRWHYTGVLLLWLVLSLAVTVGYTSAAISRLRHRFRREAALRFEPSSHRRWWPFRRRATR